MINRKTGEPPSTRPWWASRQALATVLTLALVSPTLTAATAVQAQTTTTPASTVVASVARTAVTNAPVNKVAVAAPALQAASTVYPNRYEGIISMTRRTCGTTGNWANIAAANGVTGPEWTVYYGHGYTVNCNQGPPTTSARTQPQRASRSTTSTAPASSSVQKVLSYARAQVGDPYVWAADGPGAFDCSGLVMASYRQADISLPHQTAAMLSWARKHKKLHVSSGNLQPGDVVWLQEQKGRRGHVGLYLGEGQVVEASSGKGRVVIRAMGSRYWTAYRMI